MWMFCYVKIRINNPKKPTITSRFKNKREIDSNDTGKSAKALFKEMLWWF